MNRRSFFGALVGGIAAATGVRALAGRRVAFFKTAATGKTDVALARLYSPFCGWDIGKAFPPLVPTPGRALVEQVAAQVPGHLVEGVESIDGGLALSVAPRPVAAREEVALGVAHDRSDGITAAAARLRDGPTPQERGEHLLQRSDTPAQLSPFGVDLCVLPQDALPQGFDPAAFWERTGSQDRAPSVPRSADLPEIWPGFSTPISATATLHPLVQTEHLMELFGASGDAAPSFAAALIGELVLTRLRLADLRRIHASTGLAP